jgi:heme A synthase
MQLQQLSRFARFAWGVLAYNLGVVLWGAYVRASGSGAGCGSHWPLCNGEVVPRSRQVETLVELTHRATSGIALLLVVAMLVWALRSYPRGHLVRRGAKLAMLLMVLEALLGAGLVLFELVADNASMARAFAMAAHLVNTFFLIGAITLTAWWASGGRAVQLRGQGMVGWSLAVGILGFLLLGVSGAVTALGDTLFPARSLTEGIRQDFSPTAHLLLRLRILHPLIAIGVGLYLVLVAALVGNLRPSTATHRLARTLTALFLLQIGAGFLNLALLAPIWLQLVHLLLADLVWIALVLLTASALAARHSGQSRMAPYAAPLSKDAPVPASTPGAR